MSESFISPKTFARDLFINFLSGLAGGGIAGIFAGKFWLGVLTFLSIFAVLLFCWLQKKYARAIKVILSGHAGYYYSFDLEENPKVWEEAKTSFCYLGISTDSVLEFFRRWIDKNPVSRYQILLMSPDAKALRRQEAFRKGIDIGTRIDDLPLEIQQHIDETVEATRQRIMGAIAILKNTRLYKDGVLQIKIYDEFTPWWMYLIDDRKAYIGILEKGKRGSESPVLVMEQHIQYTTPFDAFKNHWERLWQSAVDV